LSIKVYTRKTNRRNGNIDTDLRLSFIGALREVLTNKPEEFDPRKILGPGREAIEQTVQSKIRLFGSSGKAA
jgi:fructose-bisphosphate aldolase class II